ncbi:unnamed protein product [Brachionus calyciflorus]|uniref:Uncharacterized protein n=1 Tax=Brachionus calyciflorus TaxID=104777 RepID=A0A813UT93_9BILA|nr:unnamed protein product [Brachionus calyciflorus]
MNFTCDHCLIDVQNQVPITLSCGYTICFNHMNELDNVFNCLVCKNHQVSKQDCFKMNKNRSMLLKFNYSELINDLKEELDTLNSFSQVSIQTKFNNLVEKINFRREKLKADIDLYADDLIKKLTQNKLDFEAKINETLKNIDSKEYDQYIGENLAKRIKVEDEINHFENKTQALKVKLENLKQKVEEVDKQKEYLEKLDFNIESDIKFENLFGSLKIPMCEIKKEIKSEWDKKLPETPELIKMQKVCSLPVESVWCIDQLSTGELVTGSDDTNIRIINLETHDLIKSIKAHSNVILDLKVDHNDKIYTTSNDCTVKVWDKDGKCLLVIQHEIPINCMELWGDVIIGCDEAGEIIKWDKQTGLVVSKIKAHSKSINSSTMFDTDHILTGSDDHSIKLWDLRSEKCIKKMVGHEREILTLEKLNDTEFISGSDDNTCRIWNSNTGHNVVTLKANFKCVPVFNACKRNYFLSCSTDGIIRLWSRVLKKWVGKLTQQSGVYYMKLLKNGQLVCCCEDGTISIWKQNI